AQGARALQSGGCRREPVLVFALKPCARIRLVIASGVMNEFEYSPDSPVDLEWFENPEPNRRYEIEFTCPEWTAVCPRSGFPDFGVIHIKYIPKERCVELKSLKLYIN